MIASLAPNRTLEYEEKGSGAPLVLLHAFPMTGAMWRDQIDDWSRDFRVIAPTLPASGQSTFTLENAARDVADLLDALKINGLIILGGLSMGGYIAFEFAHQFPQRLRALILADTKAEADSPEAKIKRDEMIEFARDHSGAEVFEKMLPNLMGQTTRDSRTDVIEGARQIASTLNSPTLVSLIEALRDRRDSTPILAQIAVPTLVICGDEDIITPPDGARNMAHAIANSRLEIISKAGHLSNLEQPHEFKRVVREFLMQLP
jgi:3-oxoadipate enol-lactonase